MGRTPPRALARAAHAPSLSPGEQRGVCAQGAAGCWLGTALLAARAGWSPGSSPSGRLGQLRGRRCRPHRAGPCGEKVSRRARRVRSHALPQLWSREGAGFCSATRPLRRQSRAAQHARLAMRGRLPGAQAQSGTSRGAPQPSAVRASPSRLGRRGCETLARTRGASATSPVPSATGPLASASSRVPEPEWGR